MKKILITGAGGFIGSHLSELCVKKGFKVRAFVHYNSQNSWGWLEESEYKDQMDVLAGDIRDFDSVFNAMKDVDTVFHLAALIGIPYSYVSPLAYIKTNILGTYNVLQSGKQHGIGNILITSTSETYGTAQYVPINENHPMVGQSPYSATKISADHIALSYNRSFGMPVRIVRPFNVYGPRQSARAVIPTIISQILSSQKEIRMGSLEPSRDLTFVKDTASAYLAVAKSDKLVGEIINVGMNEEIVIGDLARKIADLIGADVKFVSDRDRIRPEKSEVFQLKCDNSRILDNTDWRPEYTREQGLSETIEWFRDHLESYKPGMYNI